VLTLTDFLNVVYWSAAVAIASLSAVVSLWCAVWIVEMFRGLLGKES